MTSVLVSVLHTGALHTGALHTGAVLPGGVMDWGPVRVLQAFVTINTVMYCALAVAKILPRLHPTTWFRRPTRRAEERGIHPAGWTATAPADDDAGGPSASRGRPVLPPPRPAGPAAPRATGGRAG